MLVSSRFCCQWSWFRRFYKRYWIHRYWLFFAWRSAGVPGNRWGSRRLQEIYQCWLCIWAVISASNNALTLSLPMVANKRLQNNDKVNRCAHIFCIKAHGTKDAQNQADVIQCWRSQTTSSESGFSHILAALWWTVFVAGGRHCGWHVLRWLRTSKCLQQLLFMVIPGAYERRSHEGACKSGSIQILITYVFPFWHGYYRLIYNIHGFGEAECASCGLSPTLGYVATWENKRWQNCKYKKCDSRLHREIPVKSEPVPKNQRLRNKS